MKKNLLLFLSALIVSLLVLEFALRFFCPETPKQADAPKENWALVPERVWTEYHPVLGWYHEKNKDAVLKVKDTEIPVHTNSLGLRGHREYAVPKPAGKLRILALGDSFVFGFGVKEEETFASLLEKKIPGVEVPNLGVPGYGMDQILLLYRLLGKQLAPDVVLIGVFPEDFWRCTRSFADSGHAKPYFLLRHGQLVQQNMPVPEDFTLNTNQFPPLVEYSPAEEFLLTHSVLYRRLRKAFFKLGKGLGLLDPETGEEWIVGREVLLELVKEVEASGARPVLVLNPPERWVRADSKEKLYRSILRLAKRESLEFLDLTPYFQEAVKQSPLTDYYIQDDWHWTPKGHEIAAEKIAAFLTEKGFLPPAPAFNAPERVKSQLVASQTAVN